MNEYIVSSDAPITVVGGAEATPQDLHKALSLAPICVAADGGALLAQREGVPMAAVIGDFDSIPTTVTDTMPLHLLHRIEEQMSTDFEKVLMRVKTPLIIGVGFLGGRLDHELAALHSLLAFAHQPCILLGPEQIVFHAPPVIDVPTTTGDLVSLFPMGQVRGRSDGLAWPIEGLDFAPGRKIGTSNAATGPMRLEMEGPGMLVIVPARLIRAVVGAFLRQQRAPWPVLAG